MAPTSGSALALLVLAASHLLGGCLFDDGAKDWRHEYEAALRSVEPADGIDEREARLLAGEYFMTYISMCGVVGSVLPRDPCWEVTPHIGYVGAPAEPIRIDMRTGITSWTRGPTVTATSLIRGEIVIAPDP